MHRLVVVVIFCLGFIVTSGARAGERGPAHAEASATPAGLLAAADAALGAHDLPLATTLFQRIAAEYPATPEASEARRALTILALQSPALAAPAKAPAPTMADSDEGEDGDVVVRDEPYSRRTSERLRLSIWEKVDFGVTAFLYGMSFGFSFALSQDTHTASDVLTPIALGALTYTLGSVAFLKLANPDRGDLPLALAITSYLPTTALLVTTAADAGEHSIGAAAAVAGLVSIPTAILAARHLDLDPGDAQLVRDAGFWGLALSTLGTLGFGGSTTNDWGYSDYHAPSGRKVAAAGLVGLYGGLGLGLVAASASEVSLERVRVSTWGGYGGAVVGLLLGASMNDGREQDIYRGATIGALAGVVITFLATRSLDGIPDEVPARASWHRRFVPTMVQVASPDGSLHPGFGVGGTL